MSAVANSPRLFVSLSFTPKANLVSAISKLVADFCSVAMENADTAWLFYMAAHELAENVTKYSTSSNVSLEVEMSEREGKHVMKITSRNETTPERLRETARRLDAIKNAEDPVALYDQLVLESAPMRGVSARRSSGS